VKSNKPTIVLAPGFMTDHDLWRDVVPHFSDYNVVYADFREGAMVPIREMFPPIGQQILSIVPQRVS
jgi:pimeloyl-ACP methyl ester carboxylesterase